MIKKRTQDLTLKLGNLLLAISLATVPTAITYGVLGIHGINVCSSLDRKIQKDTDPQITSMCKEASWETTRSYIVLIGFFITLPTWLWFYMSVKKKQKKIITSGSRQ